MGQLYFKNPYWKVFNTQAQLDPTYPNSNTHIILDKECQMFWKETVQTIILANFFVIPGDQICLFLHVN